MLITVHDVYIIIWCLLSMIHDYAILSVSVSLIHFWRTVDLTIPRTSSHKVMDKDRSKMGRLCTLFMGKKKYIYTYICILCIYIYTYVLYLIVNIYIYTHTHLLSVSVFWLMSNMIHFHVRVGFHIEIITNFQMLCVHVCTCVHVMNSSQK